MKRMRRRAATAALLLAWSATVATPCVAGDATSGQARAATCATCHGMNGLSTLPNAPHLAGQPEIYLVEQLRAYRSGKRANEVMAVIAKALSDNDIDDLAAWYASIEITVKPP